jgi:hypothetical protein
MRRLIVPSILFVSALVFGSTLGARTTAVLAGGFGLLAAAVWWFGQCHHPRPLSLLPPMTDAEGRRQPAQWFCAHCGQRFPADFEHDSSPVPRFTGYDEAKAVAAAKRAADLEQNQRRLALKRAGLKRSATPPAPPAATPSAPAPTRPEPVRIDTRRAG